MKKILYGSLLLSILQSILFWHKSPGISVILFIIPTILVILYNLKEQKMIKNKKGILWSIPIILLSLTYFIFNNTFFQLLNVSVIFALLILMCINITEEKISENRFIRNIISKAFNPFKISKRESIKLYMKWITPHPNVLNKSNAFNNIYSPPRISL